MAELKLTIDEVFEKYKEYMKEKQLSPHIEAYFWDFVLWFKNKTGTKIPYTDIYDGNKVK